MASIVDIEGIGPAQAEKLQKSGVRSTAALLKRGGKAKALWSWQQPRTSTNPSC
jgi:hypothetical protein